MAVKTGFVHTGFLTALVRTFKPPDVTLRLGPVKILVVGSGGREHALAWKLAQSAQLEELHAAPGNPGIDRIGRCHPIRADDVEGLLGLCRQHELDLVVIGPEAPLVAGVADHLRRAGVSVFGPGAGAARIEGSKAFAKEVMRSAGVPTAATLQEPRAPCVVKADGLAAGKGVFVCRTQEQADEGWRRAQALGGEVVLEELLEGEEVSLFALTDGIDALALAPAQDFKRLRDGDEGPNTGGMGSYSPVPFLSADEVEELVALVHRPVLEELAGRGTPFVGLLYAGLMLTDDGPRVLEFNCRFGDPETQAILPRLEGDFLGALACAASGALGSAELAAGRQAAATVVLASDGYPEDPRAGTPIEGLEEAEAAGALVFQAGTALRDGRLVSAGGRVLNVTGLGDSLDEARAQTYAAIERIDFPGAQYRTDVALRAVHVPG
jgi:phosphoribosylamine---glycine ligase